MKKEKTDKYPSAKETEKYLTLPDYKVIKITFKSLENNELFFDISM